MVFKFSGLGAIAAVRSLTWQTSVYGLVVPSEWKGNSDRGFVD